MNLSRPKRGKLASTARFFCKKSYMPIDPKNIIIKAGKRKNSEKYIVAIKKTKLNNQTYNNTEKRPQISPISIFPSPEKNAPIFTSSVILGKLNTETIYRLDDTTSFPNIF